MPEHACNDTTTLLKNMENQLPVKTQLLGGQHGGGEAGALLLASEAPLSILGYLVFFCVCVWF